jgi:hypothetical protein
LAYLALLIFPGMLKCCILFRRYPAPASFIQTSRSKDKW